MWIEANLHVADAAGHFCRRLELFDREVALAHPGTDDSIIVKDVRGIERFLFRTRQLNRAPTFAQGFFFSSEDSIDQSQDTERWLGMWICANRLLLFRARRSKSSPRPNLIPFYSGDQTFPVISTKRRRTHPSCLKVIAVAGNHCR